MPRLLLALARQQFIDLLSLGRVAYRTIVPVVGLDPEFSFDKPRQLPPQLPEPSLLKSFQSVDRGSYASILRETGIDPML